MAVTKTLIISNAVSLLGHEPVIDLDSSDSMVVSASQAFDMLLPAVLCENNWRFAVTIQQLSELNETPPVFWKTVFSLPAGYLKTIRVYPQQYDWEIYENKKIYSMYTPGDTGFYMEYVFQPDISLLPPNFVKYFTYEIASYLALSNAERPDYAQFLESKRVTTQAMAIATDAQNRPQSSQVNFPVLDKRGVCGVMANSIS